MFTVEPDGAWGPVDLQPGDQVLQALDLDTLQRQAQDPGERAFALAVVADRLANEQRDPRATRRNAADNGWLVLVPGPQA